MHGSRTTLIAVFVVIATTAVAHGVVTNRWNGGDALPVLPEIPKQFGDWIGEDLKSDVSDPGIAHLSRRYTHAASGRSFVISLSLGHPGLTAVHTPEYCYTGSGYEMEGAITRFTVRQPAAEFWTTAFQKPGGADALRIYWAWSAQGAWRAPGYPRLAFLGQRSLCKLYVVAGGVAPVAPGQDAQLDDFFLNLLGSLNGALFAPADKTPRGSPTPPSRTEAVRS
jgi:hypothetical protein